MKLCLRTLRKQSHWFLLGLVILLTLYMDVYVARNVLDGDVSDFLYCGNIFAREKDLFSTNYYYSTEVRPLDLSSVFSFFFLLTGQWTLVHVLGTITVQTIYALSFLFMTRQAGLSRKTRVTVAALSLLPFSIPYARIVLYHLYYTLYLANMFFIIGLTLWTLRCGKGGLKQALLPAVLLGLLWIFVGLNGIRHMLLIGIPLLVGCIVELLRAFRKAPWVYGKPWRQQALLHTEVFRLTLLMVGSCLCFLAGFVVNQHVLLPYYGIVNSSSAWYAPIQTAQRYADIWNGWLTAIGVRNSALSLVGIRGLSLAAALVSFVWLLYRSVCFLRKGGTMEQRLLGGLYALSMFSTTLVFVFDSGCRFYELYYVPVIVLALPTLALELDDHPPVLTARKALCFLVSLCFLFQGAYSAWYLRVERRNMDTWSGLTHQDLTCADECRDCVAFMQENGYQYGMMPYWHANVMIELSNGSLTILPYEDAAPPEEIQVYHWGTSRFYCQRENLPDELVVFVPHGEADRFAASHDGARLVWEGWRYAALLVPTDEVVQ